MSRLGKQDLPVSRPEHDYKKLFHLARWLAIAFVLVTVHLPTSHVYIKPGVYAVAAIAGLFDLIWYYLLPQEPIPKTALVELVFDIFWITLMQVPTGQIHSPYYFLFALPILASAFVLDRRSIHLIGCISATLLIPVLFLHLWGQPLDLNHFFSFSVRFGLIAISTYFAGLLAEGKV